MNNPFETFSNPPATTRSKTEELFPLAVKGGEGCLYRRVTGSSGGEAGSAAHPHAVYLPDIAAGALSTSNEPTAAIEAHGWKASFDHNKQRLYFSKLSDKKQRCWTLPAYTSDEFNNTPLVGEIGADAKKTKKKKGPSKHAAGAPKKKKKGPSKKASDKAAVAATATEDAARHSQGGGDNSSSSDADSGSNGSDDDDGRGYGGSSGATPPHPLQGQLVAHQPHSLSEEVGGIGDYDANDPFSLPQHAMKHIHRAAGDPEVAWDNVDVGYAWGMGPQAPADPYIAGFDDDDDGSGAAYGSQPWDPAVRSTAPAPNAAGDRNDAPHEDGGGLPTTTYSTRASDEEVGAYEDDDRGASELHRQERNAVHVASSVEIPDDAVPPVSSPMPLNKGGVNSGGRGHVVASPSSGAMSVPAPYASGQHDECAVWDARVVPRQHDDSDHNSADDGANEPPVARTLSHQDQDSAVALVEEAETDGREDIVGAEASDRDIIDYERAADFECVSFNQPPPLHTVADVTVPPPVAATAKDDVDTDIIATTDVPVEAAQRDSSARWIQSKQDVTDQLQELIMTESANNTRKENAVERELAILIQKRALQERAQHQQSTLETTALEGAVTSSRAVGTVACEQHAVADSERDAGDRTPLEALLEQTAANDGGVESNAWDRAPHSPLLRDDDFPLSSLAAHVRVDSIQLAARPEQRHDYVVDAKVHPEHHASPGGIVLHPFEPTHHRPTCPNDGRVHPAFVDEPPTASNGPTTVAEQQQQQVSVGRRQRAVVFADIVPPTASTSILVQSSGDAAAGAASIPADQDAGGGTFQPFAVGRRRTGPPAVVVVPTIPPPGTAGILLTGSEQPSTTSNASRRGGGGLHEERPHFVTLVEPSASVHVDDCATTTRKETPAATTALPSGDCGPDHSDSPCEHSPSFGPRIDSFSDGSPASAELPPSFAATGRGAGRRLRNARDSFIIALHPDEHRAYVESLSSGRGGAAAAMARNTDGDEDDEEEGQGHDGAATLSTGGRGGPRRLRNARDSFVMARNPTEHETYVQMHAAPGGKGVRAESSDAVPVPPQEETRVVDGEDSMSLGNDSVSSPRGGGAGAGRLRRARDSFFIASHPGEHRAYVQNRIATSATTMQQDASPSVDAPIEAVASSADVSFPRLSDSVALAKHPQDRRAYVQEQLLTMAQLSGLEWEAIEQQRRLGLAQDRHAAVIDDAASQQQLHQLDATQALARLRQLQDATTKHSPTVVAAPSSPQSAATTQLLQREDALRWIQEEARRRTGRSTHYNEAVATPRSNLGANDPQYNVVHWLQPPQSHGDHSAAFFIRDDSLLLSPPRTSMGDDPKILLEQRIAAVMQRLLAQDAMYLYQEALDAKLLESADWSLAAMQIYQRFVDTMPPKAKDVSVQAPETMRTVVECGTNAPQPTPAFTPSFPLGQALERRGASPLAVATVVRRDDGGSGGASATQSALAQQRAGGVAPPHMDGRAQRAEDSAAEEEDVNAYLRRIERIRALQNDHDGTTVPQSAASSIAVGQQRQQSTSATQQVGMWASRHRATQTPPLPRELSRTDAGAALDRLRHGRAVLEQYHVSGTSPRTTDGYDGATPLGYERAPNRQATFDVTPIRPIYGGVGPAGHSTPSSVISTPPPLPGSALSKPHASGQHAATFLRWDVNRSGNVLVSQSGALTMADSSRALKALQEEAASSRSGGGDHRHRHPSTSSPRVTIPMYALGTIGISQGDFVFECRFELRPSKEVVAQTSSHLASGGNGASITGPRRPAASVVSSTVLRPGQRRPQHAVFIGVASKYYRGSQRTTAAYLYCSDGSITATSTEGRGVPYGQPLHANAVVTVHLSFSRRELSFAVDGVPQGVAFKFQRQDDPEPLFPLVVFTGDGDSCAFQPPTLPSPPGGAADRAPLQRAAASSSGVRHRDRLPAAGNGGSPWRDRQEAHEERTTGGRSGGGAVVGTRTSRYDGRVASPPTPRDVSRSLY